uniref:Charged multivesicular body protein 2b n=1 Tax=Syphacia muris TaxID=451379 RepID=A0A0N5AVN0_9BILA
MRKNNRCLQRTSREIQSDKRLLERQEKELEEKIKKLAKAGQKEACTSLAKQLVQIRKQQTRNDSMTAHLNAIQAQNTNAYSAAKMAQVAGNATKVMKNMEKQFDYSKISKNLREYAAFQERFGLTDEMVNETLDSMLDVSGDEEETDAIVNQVLDELNIDMNAQVITNSAKMTDSDLENMLAKLHSS